MGSDLPHALVTSADDALRSTFRDLLRFPQIPDEAPGAPDRPNAVAQKRSVSRASSDSVRQTRSRTQGPLSQQGLSTRFTHSSRMHASPDRPRRRYAPTSRGSTRDRTESWTPEVTVPYIATSSETHAASAGFTWVGPAHRRERCRVNVVLCPGPIWAQPHLSLASSE